MHCPDKETLQDLVDGELQKSKVPQVIEHIRLCDKCKTEFREILSLYNALSKAVAKDVCPSIDALKNYAQKALPTEEMDKVKEHIEFCNRCESYLWLFRASEAELAEWQANEKLSYQKFRARSLGYDAAKESLKKLLPGKVELFDRIWESVLNLVVDLKNKTAEQWPTFKSPGQLMGVLGFSETSDPESNATSIILATTLFVAQEIADGEVNTTLEDIRAAVLDAAQRFGAGKELQARLSETVPELIMKSL